MQWATCRASFVLNALFPLFFMHQASRAGKQDLVCFQCNAFCLKREQVKQLFVFLNTIFLSKRNIGVVRTWGVATRAAGPPRRQGSNDSRSKGSRREKKAAAAAAAAWVLVLVAHSLFFFASGEQQQQMQQQQSHSPRPIAQLTAAAQARAREGQQRQDLGTTAAPAQ